MKLEFPRQVMESTQVSGFMTIRPVEAELFHPNGQTDMTKLIFAFRKFAKTLKNSLLCLLSFQYLNLKINKKFSFHVRILCHGINVRLWWYIYSKGKGKSVPLQAWSGPEGSRKLRFPDFMTTAQGGGKVVDLMHRQLLPPGNSPGTLFC